MKKKIYIYLFDGYADWEIAYATPEIKKNNLFELIYFSKDGKDVVSMGGLTVSVAKSMDDVRTDDMTMLILPGGTMWEERRDSEIEELIRKTHTAGKSVAAICGAVTCLANMGILDKVKHTGNDLNYLKALVPGYTGETLYQHTPAFEDQGVITASGIGAIEFAKAIFLSLDLHNGEGTENWYQLFKYGIWKG